MDYVIVNANKNVYIRLNDKGSPETCTKQAAQKFEKSKAKNILDNLPRSLKRFHFKIQVVPEEIIHKKEQKKEEIIVDTCYTIPQSVNRWVERCKTCNDLAEDESKRTGELIQAL